MANDLPTPAPNLEKFAAKAAGMDIETPTPVTNMEKYLDAIAKGGGVSPDDAYTKEQTDALLDEKVDKVSGKGLSTNDFTDTDKANLATALEKANAAAPQSTTYTKAEVDTALAAKLNTADVDDALSSTSTNPVQNKAVRAPIARLVDAGAKNLFDLDNSTFTSSPVNTTTATKNANGSVLISATGSGVRVARFTVNLQSGVTYRLSGCPSGGGAGTYSLDIRDLTNNQIPDSFDTGSGSGLFTVPTSGTYYLGTRFANGYNTPSEGVTFYPMICTAEDYAISQEFVPYAPSNRELYEMILALQNGG